MDKIKIRQWLDQSIGNSIQWHPECVDELIDQVSRSGVEKPVIRQLISRVLFMLDLDIDHGLKWLEKLKHEEGLYSLRIDAAKTNYRIIFSRDNGGRLFLHTFYEQSGKKDTSYKAHIKIAKKRRDDMIYRR